MNSAAVAPTAAAGGVGTRLAWHEILVNVRHDARRITLVVATGLALTALAAWLAPKSYTADASLLLRLGREYVYTPEVGEPASATPMAYDRDQTLQAEARILMSRDVLEKVVAAVGETRLCPSLAGGTDALRAHTTALLALQRGLDAELLKGSNLLQVSFTHKDPQVAALVLQHLVDAYLEKRMQVFASPGFQLAESEFALRRKRLEEVEARLAAFKKAHGIRSFSEEQTLLLSQRNALEQRDEEVALALAQAAARSGALNSRLRQVPEEVALATETQRGEAAESTLRLLLDLRLKERDLSARYFDNEPAVQDVRGEIASAQSWLRDLQAAPPRTVRVGRNPVRDAVESDLSHSLADQGQGAAGKRVLKGQLGSVEHRLSRLAGSEGDLHALERDRRLAEADYEASAKRLRDERSLADLDRRGKTSVSVVQRPAPPLEGHSARPLIVVLGCLLSLAAGLLTGLLCALWRDTPLTPSQVQRDLGLPVLATVARRAG